MTLLLLLLSVLLGGCAAQPSEPQKVSASNMAILFIHEALYQCEVRETAVWNTDMIICWPIGKSAATGHSQGVMRFWRENPKGLVGMPPCETVSP